MYNRINVLTSLIIGLSGLVGCTSEDESVHINEVPECIDYVECNLASTCIRPENVHINNTLKILAKSESNGEEIVNAYLNGCFNSNNKTGNKEAFIEDYLVSWTMDIDPTKSELNPHIDTLYSSPVVVHELSHALIGILSGSTAECCEGEIQMTFFLQPDELVVVPYTRSVSSQLISSKVIDEVKNMGTSYEFYIGTGPHSSFSTGGYGLLDEFNAYYQSSNVIFGFYNHLISMYQTTNDDIYLKTITMGFTGAIISYYEFKYYNYLYLSYIKENYPAVYNEVMANEAFLAVLDQTNQRYTLLVLKMVEKFENEPMLNNYLTHYNEIKWYFNLLSTEINSISWK